MKYLDEEAQKLMNVPQINFVRGIIGTGRICIWFGGE